MLSAQAATDPYTCARIARNASARTESSVPAIINPPLRTPLRSMISTALAEVVAAIPGRTRNDDRQGLVVALELLVSHFG